MRLISALAILLLISSCAYNRIRLVKAQPRQIVNVDQSKSSNKSDDHSYHVADQQSDNNQDVAEVSSNISPDFILDEPAKSTLFLQPQDSTSSEGPELSQEEYDSAIKAERRAKAAKNMTIGAFPALLTPGIGFIVSLVLFGIGSILYFKAKRSRYTTAEGQYQEEKARKWRLAYLIMMGVMLLLVAAVIFVFVI